MQLVFLIATKQRPDRCIGRFNDLTCERWKRLSFGADFVASEFPAPAWRNWQTRWTQNPVIARSCGFEPLRRHNSWALDVERRAFDAWQRVFVCVLATTSERCLDFARHDDLVRSCRHELPPAVFTPGCIRSAGKFDCADALK